MDNKEELRHYIKAVCHIGEAGLIAYHEGALAEAEREKVHAHLAQCAECQTTLKDIRAFLEPTREERDASDDPEVRQQLHAFWQRVGADPVKDAPSVPPEGVAAWPWWRSSFAALAAGLILFVLAGGWLWTWQRHRSQQADWQGQVAAAWQSLDALRAENQQLRTEQKQTQEKIVQLAARVEALAAPKLNAPVALIYSLGATRRPGEQTVFSPVAVPQGAPFITLVLYKASKIEYSDYSVELRNPRNEMVWRAAGLTLNATLDAYTLNLPTELVLPATGAPPRDYILVVYGEGSGRRIPVDHYGLRFLPKS